MVPVARSANLSVTTKFKALPLGSLGTVIKTPSGAGHVAARSAVQVRDTNFDCAPTVSTIRTSLASLGPNMALAKDLLDRGEAAAVLEYLRESGEFWHADRGKLAEWTALIRAGLKPDFGANLTY